MNIGGPRATLDDDGEEELEARLRQVARSAGTLAHGLSPERTRVGDRRRHTTRRVVVRALVISAVAAALVTVVLVPRQRGVANRPGPSGPSFETLDVTSSAAPSPRTGEAVAYFPPDKEVVLFGGAPAPAGAPALGDTWVFSNHGWQQLSTASSPSPRAGAAMAYDPAMKELVLFGGSSDPSPGVDAPLTDSWAFDGTGWHRLRPPHSPVYLPVPAMAYDVTTDRLTLLAPVPSLYNGHSPGGQFALFRTNAFVARWIWTGSDWSYAPTLPAPNVQTGDVAFVAVPASNTMLYYSYWWLTNCGGCGPNPPSGPTGARGALAWTWDGHRFVEQHPREAPQSASLVVSDQRVGHVVAVARGRTWEWVGTSWVVAGVGAPTDDLAHAAAYDAALGDVIVVGGTESTVTWTWDGTKWRAVPPPARPACSQGPTQLLVTDGLAGHGQWPLVALYQFVVLEPISNGRVVTDLRAEGPASVFEPQGQGWKLAGELPVPAPNSGPPSGSSRAVVQFTRDYTPAGRYLIEVPFRRPSGGAGSPPVDLCTTVVIEGTQPGATTVVG